MYTEAMRSSQERAWKEHWEANLKGRLGAKL